MFREPEVPAMATATVTIEPSLKPKAQTLQDLVDRLGGIPLFRIRLEAPIGRATEEDVIKVRRETRRLCELVDGILVEKGMGFRESLLAGVILAMLRDFVVPRNLGLVSVADGMIKLGPGLVRIPDVAFFEWKNVPGGEIPDAPIPRLSPTLAVEVLGPSNTKAEMQRKRREYFETGVEMVWQIDPSSRSASVYRRNQKRPRKYVQSGTIEEVPGMPGFRFSLGDLFSELDRKADRLAQAGE